MSGDRIDLHWATHADPEALVPAWCGTPETIRLAGRVAASLTVASVLIAVVVRTWFAAAARRWLAYPFTGIPPRFGEAASIFGHNLRALTAVAGLLLIAQSPHCNMASSKPGAVHTSLQRLGEAVLGTGVAVNVSVIGASFGAYGTRMLRAAIPHGPVELAAYSLSLALYLRGRRHPLPVRHILTLEGLSVALLAVAAALETFVTV